MILLEVNGHAPEHINALLEFLTDHNIMYIARKYEKLVLSSQDTHLFELPSNVKNLDFGEWGGRFCSGFALS